MVHFDMTGRVIAWMLILTLTAGLTGCGETELPADTSLVRVTYDRSHGSIWGIQFYIDLTETEIVRTHFFPAGEGTLKEVSHIPVTAEQWKEIEQKILTMAPSLTVKKGEKLGFFKKQKLDGAESRTLTLTWEKNNKQQTISYDWPNIAEAAALEELLEVMVREAVDQTEK